MIRSIAYATLRYMRSGRDQTLMTPAEVAALFRVSRQTIWRWSKDGTLEAVQLGPKITRFRRADVDALLGDPEPSEAA